MVDIIMKLKHRILLLIYSYLNLNRKVKKFLKNNSIRFINIFLCIYYKFKHPKNAKLMKEVKEQYDKNV